MDSSKLYSTVEIIKEDEGLIPLTMQELRDRKGETVFLMSEVAHGYAIVDVDKLAFKLFDEDSDWISLSGKTFYAYSVRPYTVGV